jgi:hypothetical protein
MEENNSFLEGESLRETSNIVLFKDYNMSNENILASSAQ